MGVAEFSMQIHYPGSAGASCWNTTGEPLKPACMLSTFDEVQNHKCQKLNKIDMNLKLHTCRDSRISGFAH